MPGVNAPILVTGAAGTIGGVGRRAVEILRAAGVPVRALVRRDDARAEHLRALGADVAVVDLTKSEEIYAALKGCRRVLFCMSVGEQYLEATAVTAAAARAVGDIELFVNISQMTVSQMDVTHPTPSPHHRVQWLSEQVLDWSGVPVVHLRPTVFQENLLFWGTAAKSIAASGTIRLPLARSRTSPIAANDVAEVAVKALLDPAAYRGRVIDLTGPRSADLHEFAKEYAAALGRPVEYVDVPLEAWAEQVLKPIGLSAYGYQHILTAVKMHAAGRYDRYTNAVEEILGRPAASISETIRVSRSQFPLDTAHN